MLPWCRQILVAPGNHVSGVVHSLRPGICNAHIYHWIQSLLVPAMICRLWIGFSENVIKISIFSLKKIQSNVASLTLWSFISAIKLKSLTLFRPQYASLWPTVRSYKELPLKCGMLNCACSTVVVHGTERVDTHSALQGGVLLLPSDAVASLLANGSAVSVCAQPMRDGVTL